MGGGEPGRQEWKVTKNRGFFLGPESNTPTCNDLLWVNCIKSEQLVVHKLIQRKLEAGGQTPQRETEVPPWMKEVTSPKARVPPAVENSRAPAWRQTPKKLDDVGVMKETLQMLRKAKKVRSERQKALTETLESLQMPIVRSKNSLSKTSVSPNSSMLRLPAINVSPSRAASKAA